MKKYKSILAMVLAVIMLLTGTAYATDQSKSTKNDEIPSRQEILDILLKSHSEGSRFSTPKPTDMEKIQKWLSATKLDKMDKEEDFIAYHLAYYQLNDEYNLTLTAKRTLILSNKEGWAIETYNVDYSSMEIGTTNFAVTKNGTYVSEEGKLFFYKLGEKTEVTGIAITDTTCIWNTNDYQMMYIQDGNDLQIILSDGTFVKIASDYGYGIKMIPYCDGVVLFGYISAEKKQEAVVVYEKEKENNLLATMLKYSVAICVETM